MNKMKKLLSSLLALSMVLSYVPMPAVAEEVCTHHAHDDKCGYVQAVEGKSCTHQCTESCPKKDVTVCVHDHVKLGCAHTPAVEGVACDHIHGEGCGYVPAQAAVPCTCGAVAAHTAQCASLVTEGAECDCGMPTLHAEGCEPKAAVAEQCSHVHGACAYKAAVQESWGCGHVCTKDSGCVKAVCAHAHDASCGYVQAVKGSDCTFVCTECKEEEKTCTCGAAEEGEDEHAPFCDLYVRTYEECKCVLDCAVEGLNDYCETCYFEGVEACTGGEDENVTFESGTIGELSYTLDESGNLTISGSGAIQKNAFKNRKDISVVIIGDGVTTIGSYAFSGCSKLTSVTILGSVKTIGSSAFSGCFSLTTINYYGLTAPIASSAIFGKNPPSTINVPENYKDETFADQNVYKSISPVNTSTAYTITFNPSGGSGNMEPATGISGEYTLPACTFTAPSGQKFKAWRVGETEYQPGETITVSTNTTVTAVWENLDQHVHEWDSFRGVCSGCEETHGDHEYTWTDGACSVCGVVGGYCGYTGDETLVEYVLTSEDNGSTYTITISGTGKMGEYNAVNQPWSSYCGKITTAVVKSGVRDVGWGAFKNHTKLTSVSIPDSITTIGSMAFSGTTSLRSITLPSALTSLGSNAFYNSGIQSITIPAGVTKIQYNTFQKSKLSSINLGSVTTIGTNAFQGCQQLTSITLPSTLTTIGNDAFSGSNLTSVTIPSSVTKIGERAFQGCNALKTVSISGGDLIVMTQAFWSDDALETLTITNTGTVTLGKRAFALQSFEQDKLNSITLPQNVIFTGSYADVFEYRRTPVTGVSLDKTEMTVYIGNSEKLTATVEPGTATNKKVTWSSSDPNVATVDAEGNVTGVAGGTATITVTTADGSKTATCTVTVPAHTHNWTYAVEGATITATCTSANCPNTNGGSVTISASNATYDGNEKAATATRENWLADNVSIQYQKQSGENWDAATNTAPTDAGTYQASITLGSAKISAIYTVSPKTVQITGVTAESRPYQANNKTVKVAVVNTDADSVTVTVPDGYTGRLSSDAVGNYNAITLDLTNLTLSNPNYQLPQSGENLTTNVSITGTIAETDVAGIEVSYAYTGEAIQPAPIVTVNGVELVRNTDYTVTYGANTNVADGGTVKIAGKNLYFGEVEKTFTITPLEIKEEHIVLNPASTVYDGTEKTTTVAVVVNGTNVDAQYYEVTGLDVINSTIGKYPITVTGKGNYTGTATKSFEITAKQLSEAGVMLTADLTYHGDAQEPAITVKDGNTELSRTSDYTVSYEKVNENSSATPIQGAPVDAGHYNAVITGKGSYGGEIRKSFEIKPNTSIDVAPTELDDEVYTGEEIKPAVQVTGVKPTALEKDKDYTIVYENNTNAGEAKITITGIGNYAGAKKELTFTITAKALTEANVTIGETILGYEEGKTTVPEITVKDGSKTLTAGTDYVVTYLDKDGQKVDAPSAVGIYTVQVIGIADLSEGGSGNYSGTVSKTFVITDDVTAPEITGVTNGKTYYTTQKVTARDENLVFVTKNGTAITPVVATGTEVTLEGNQTATYTVAAADIAENESAITITMKPISSLDDTIENLTTENVKLSDKDAIEDVLNAVKSIRESECGNATQTEKNALDAIISKCDDLLKVITDVENAISKIQALPNPAETAPDNETAVKAYDAAKKAYDALSEHGKELVGAENKAKLDAMLKALTAYDVIKGHKSSYTRGSGKTFSLTANGYFGKFTGLKIDGRILDSKYYTAKSGSTIVTLKNSYLDSLSDGKHTVEFLYTDGSTGGDHYFRISTNNGSPFTGDNNHIMMFSGIMMTSLLCMAMMIMFVPRKKGKYQR